MFRIINNSLARMEVEWWSFRIGVIQIRINAWVERLSLEQDFGIRKICREEIHRYRWAKRLYESKRSKARRRYEL